MTADGASSGPPEPATQLNRVSLTGVLIEREALRYTPAGIAMLHGRISHRCETTEAGHRRQVEFDIAVAFAGPLAQRADALRPGQPLAISGFLAARRRLSRSLVLHASEFRVTGPIVESPTPPASTPITN
ncbi:MAG: primosomal replication protein N [Burkholderiaceae bacterium]